MCQKSCSPRRTFGTGNPRGRAPSLSSRRTQMIEVEGLTKKYPRAAAPAVARISFAVAKGEVFGLHRPEVLFLDEPTVGVDPQSRTFILDGIARLADGGLTVVYSTHYMEEAERICRRVAIVDRGRLLALDAPAALVGALGGGVVSVGTGEAPDALLAVLRRLPDVTDAVKKDGAVAIRAPPPLRVLPRILEAFASSGASVPTLEYARPTLETVFLALTGESLRD